MKYASKYGRIFYHDLHIVKDYIEFVDSNHPIYTLSPTWIVIDHIKASEYHKGYGSLLLNEFLETLPKSCGVLANPVSTDPEGLSQSVLEQWYIKHGFLSIPLTEGSMYIILPIVRIYRIIKPPQQGSYHV